MVVLGKGLGGAVFPMAALIARRDLDIAGRPRARPLHAREEPGRLRRRARDARRDRKRARCCERSRDARRARARSAARAEGAASARRRRPRHRPPARHRARARRHTGAARGRAGDVRVPRARPVVQGRPGQRADALAAAGHRAATISTPRSTSSTRRSPPWKRAPPDDADAAQPARRRVAPRLGHAHRAHRHPAALRRPAAPPAAPQRRTTGSPRSSPASASRG